MKLHYKLLLLIVFLPIVLVAKKTPKYPVSDIPAALLRNADAVIRDHNTVLEVISDDKIVYHEKYVITILKESGVDKALFQEQYSKLSSIRNIEAVIYDAEGYKVKAISNEDIVDFSAISGGTLFADNRVKLIDPMQSVYPFTVEYSFKRKYESAFYIHGWNAFYGYNTSVEKLQYKVIYPSNYKLNFQEFNLKETAVEDLVEGRKAICWRLANWEAPKKEAFSSFYQTWVPSVDISPNHFELDGYAGSLESWDSFGKFIYSLNKGKDIVPQETLDNVSLLMNDDMSDYEKIATIYKYGQDKNRYISIQVGIGGWQPFEAETVDRLSYGDCKALSNYTASLLRHFGYNALYVLVHAGNHNYIDENFVANKFNHAIACVPLQNDTVWLECTNSFFPCGYLGDFTDDRYVLLVNEKGGELVKTPKFSVEENNQSVNGIISIAENGFAKADVTVTYKGALFGDQVRLTVLDETDRRKKVIKSIRLPHFELLDYNIKTNNCRKPSIDKELTLEIPRYASLVGNRMFFHLNPMSKSDKIPAYSRNRKSPMMISRPYSENDSLVFNIPDGFKLEALPKTVEVKSEFGEYQCRSKIEGNDIVYQREFKMWKGQYPKEKYNEFVEFLEKVAKYDDAKAVLVKEISL